MYALGLTTRQISEGSFGQDHLKDIYAVDVSPELVSRVTNEVKGLLDEWRGRALEPFYPVVFFDALKANIRENGTVIKKSVYIALAVRMDGKKEVLGMWIQANEGTKFWAGILNELESVDTIARQVSLLEMVSGFFALGTAFT